LKFSISHVRREHNAEANGLAQAALRLRGVQKKLAKRRLRSGERLPEREDLGIKVSVAELLA
jgi:hypothetical protein